MGYKLSEASVRAIKKAISRINSLVMFQPMNQGSLLASIKPQEVFCVRVTKDGGSAGNAGVDCSFTYTCTAFAGGFVYGTGKTPERRRWPKVAYVFASPGSIGLATRDVDGTFILLDALGEHPDTEDPCPSSPGVS